MGTNLPDIGSYAPADVLAALLADSRTVRYRYQLIALNGAVRGLVAGVVDGGTIDYGFLNDTKRTCKLTMEESPNDDVPPGWLTVPSINFSSDRVKPYFHLLMPDGLWAEFALGVFLMASSVRTSGNGRVMRDIAGYDLSIIPFQLKAATRYVVAAGVVVTDTVADILSFAGCPGAQIVGSTETTAAQQDWDPGTPYSKIIQDLLNSINYTSLYFDENGVPRARPYLAPSDRSVEITYSADSKSVTLEDGTDTLDLWDIPNSWTLVASQVDQTVLSSSFANMSPASPTSIPVRGRTVTFFDSSDQSTSQAVIDAKVRTMAHDASQVYETVALTTANMPIHGENNILRVTHTRLGLADVFSETQWNMTLTAGGTMTHSVRRVVNIG